MLPQTILTLLGFVIFMVVVIMPITLFIQDQCQESKNWECVENTRLSMYWFVFASAIPLAIVAAWVYAQMLKSP